MEQDSDLLERIEQVINVEMIRRFGLTSNHSSLYGALDVEWRSIFMQNKDKLKNKIKRVLEEQNLDERNIENRELAKIVAQIFHEGLSLIVKTKSTLTGGGEDFHKWLRE